jgi:hypothetical protein
MEDYGIDHDRLDLDIEHLSEADQTALLGRPFGPCGAYFDPSRQGSYFQSPQDVVGNLLVGISGFRHVSMRPSLTATLLCMALEYGQT